MNRLLLIILALGLVVLSAMAAFAGQDWEFSARHQALADTGNAIFNLRGLSPSLENIACLAGSPQYNILFEGTTNTTNLITSDDDVDYWHRNIYGTVGLKTTYPTINRDDEDDFGERLAIGFIPGVRVSSYYLKSDYTDSANDEINDSLTYIQFFQRFGLAYGINEMVAVGVGFTLVPTTIIRASKTGELTVTDPSTNMEETIDPKDEYSTYAPLMFSPELGILVRPIEILQLGLSMEAGDLKSRKSDVTHSTADGDEDVTTEAIAARAPNLGFGLAVLIPDVDEFWVGFDFDAAWRRGKASDYGYYADNQELKFSLALEKMWEMSSVKGGIGYADQAGTRRYLPNDTFFVTFGTDLYFDEHVMMGLSFRGETGYMKADPRGGLSFGGGMAWTFGGSF